MRIEGPMEIIHFLFFKDSKNEGSENCDDLPKIRGNDKNLSLPIPSSTLFPHPFFIPLV